MGVLAGQFGSKCHQDFDRLQVGPNLRDSELMKIFGKLNKKIDINKRKVKNRFYIFVFLGSKSNSIGWQFSPFIHNLFYEKTFCLPDYILSLIFMIHNFLKVLNIKFSCSLGRGKSRNGVGA